MKLDQFIRKQTGCSQRQARHWIIEGQVELSGVVTRDCRIKVTRFCTVLLRGEVLQRQEAHYLMLHKPEGYLSATCDAQHKVVLSLLPQELQAELHIAGRLDLQSTGLLVLTNDGRWSRCLTAPQQKLAKVYRLETLWPITPETAAVFEQGVWFESEGLRTQPAQLEILGRREARLTIYEGRYHQVKRMFQAVDNMVLSLHRESMGGITLDAALPAGAWRRLTQAEVASVPVR
ncbi:MAG: 16S rRNA pseudouridine(516) synthase [Marinobacterium sp.]|nr:16S rRNA pseudouridine(516) synthase [Marinobacterium sp.]